MKRTWAVLLVLLMLGSMTAVAYAETSVAVKVTLADQGQLAVVGQAVTVTDEDGDGTLTINDALVALHTANGKEYTTANTEWGLSITKLWGNTDGNFGYWVNNASAGSLTDPVAEGDSVYAFIYKDGDTFSDQYCYFDQNAVAVKDDEAFTLTLTGMVYDMASWNYQPTPVAGAVITVDGEKTAYVTDAEGKVTLKVEEAGEHTISAVSESSVLVPPACMAKVTASAQPTPPPANNGEQNPNYTALIAVLVVLAVIFLAGVVVMVFYRRKDHEE